MGESSHKGPNGIIKMINLNYGTITEGVYDQEIKAQGFRVLFIYGDSIYIEYCKDNKPQGKILECIGLQNIHLWTRRN